ncbi:MAG: hypothetical protein AAB612_03580 [Patescibacteria group bacterium]
MPKTRKQKERAAQRRAKGVVSSPTPSINETGIRYSLPSFISPSKSPTAVPQKPAKVTEFSTYFKHDMLKTLVVCLIIAILIALIWWKLR